MTDHTTTPAECFGQGAGPTACCLYDDVNDRHMDLVHDCTYTLQHRNVGTLRTRFQEVAIPVNEGLAKVATQVEFFRPFGGYGGSINLQKEAKLHGCPFGRAFQHSRPKSKGKMSNISQNCLPLSFVLTTAQKPMTVPILIRSIADEQHTRHAKTVNAKKICPQGKPNG